MAHTESLPFHQNPQFWNTNAQTWGLGGPFVQSQGGYGNVGYNSGFGQAAFGHQNYGGPGGWSQGQGWGNPWQRQLSQQDVGEIVRQLIPFLPQIVGQAQQPQAAFGYGYGNSGFGGFGQGGARHLSQQDVNEVVRQILPVIPQIVSLIQGQQQGPYANAVYGGGLGWNNQGNLNPFGQAAFGNASPWGQQRQLNQAEVGEILRQLTAALPQVIANLQAFNQQQQRAA